MRRRGMNGLAAILALILVTTAGCGNQEKQQILALQNQYNELSMQNKDLRSKLSQAEVEKTQLESQLDAKNMALAGKGQEVMSLEAKLREKPVRIKPISVAKEDWDVGTFADKIAVGSDILFASGRASLRAKGKERLDRIVADLRGTYAGLPVRVYGYTDSDPIKRTKKLWKDNLDLSANRAMAVTRYLTAKGIKAETLETIAMGATHFVTENKSAAGKAKNRRVEIVVIKK